MAYKKDNKMDYKNISQLLHKYWEATSSIAEEQEIIQFYQNNPTELRKDIEQYRAFFLEIATDSQFEELEDAFDERLLKKLLESEGEHRSESINQSVHKKGNGFESSSLISSMGSLEMEMDSTNTNSKTKKTNRMLWLKPLTSIAAILALFVGLSIIMDSVNNTVKPKQKTLLVINNEKIDDPEKAYELMKASLGYISNKMKSGNKQLKHLKKFNQAPQLILKSKK